MTQVIVSFKSGEITVSEKRPGDTGVKTVHSFEIRPEHQRQVAAMSISEKLAFVARLINQTT